MFSQSSYSINENAGPLKPILVLSNPSSVDITIQVSDFQGGATSELISSSKQYIKVITSIQKMMTILLDHTLSHFLLV